MSEFDAALIGCAALDEEALARPWTGRIARRLAAVVGEVEGLGAVADAREVEARLAARLASVRL